MSWFSPWRVEFLGSWPGSKGGGHPNTSLCGFFGVSQGMGLKILSNAKIKKPVDCSQQSLRYSTAMAGGKLPVWLVDSLRYLNHRTLKTYSLSPVPALIL